MSGKDESRLSELYFSELPESIGSRVAVLPGDPDRVQTLAAMIDTPTFFTLRRGYRAVTGTYRGTPVWVVSTGVGGASLEHVLVELRELGVDTVIRVGTTGALQPGIDVGDLVVNDGAVRLDGTSLSYVRAEYPAAAAWEVVAAVVSAARATGIPTHVGVGATTASFFPGQARETFSGWSTRRSREILDEMREVGVLNFEMEAATLFTVSRLFGMRAGVVCAVVNNRLSGVMGGEDSIVAACRVALEAASQLGRVS
jgi:uridine phosphorylase